MLNIVDTETGEQKETANTLFILSVSGEPVDTIMKHKGIKPTMKTADALNPETMANVVRDNGELKVHQMNMTRDRKTGTVRTRYMDKRLRVTFSKRIFPDTIEAPSLPIGYKL